MAARRRAVIFGMSTKTNATDWPATRSRRFRRMHRSSRGSWVAGWLFRCLRGRRGSCRGWWVVQSSAAGETADRTAANHCRCTAWSRGWTTPTHTPTPHSRTHVHAHAYSGASNYYTAVFMSITTTTVTSTSTRWQFAFAAIRICSVCCHSNEIRAPIANPPNGAQLGAPSTILPSYIRVRAVVRACGEGHTHTQTRVTSIHIASSTTRTSYTKRTFV